MINISLLTIWYSQFLLQLQFAFIKQTDLHSSTWQLRKCKKLTGLIIQTRDTVTKQYPIFSVIYLLLYQRREHPYNRLSRTMCSVTFRCSHFADAPICRTVQCRKGTDSVGFLGILLMSAAVPRQPCAPPAQMTFLFLSVIIYVNDEVSCGFCCWYTV